MKELISIVLPVYNGEKYLRASIDSIINQTYKEWELLILDDCSTDRTARIANEYAEQDSRIKYIRNETNLRLPNNLNKGFSLAKGKYLTWTSDDNKFRPSALESMLCTLKAYSDKDLVYASYQIIDENDNHQQVIKADLKGRDHILGSNVVGACFMYTRKAYEFVGDYDADLMLVEDFDYWQRMFMEFDAIAIEEVLYDYRWHSDSLTSQKREEKFGFLQEKMLLKNRPGFGVLSIEQKYYYNRCLYNSRRMQGKENPYKFTYYSSLVKYNLCVRLRDKIKNILE